MPRRRLGGFSQASNQVSNLMAMILQDRLLGRRQTKQNEAQLMAQLVGETSREVGSLTPERVRAVGPQAATATYEGLRRRLPEALQKLIPQPDFQAMDTPVGERVAGLTKEISEISSPDDPRLTPAGLKRRALGHRVDPEIGVPNLLPGSSGGPSGAAVPSPDIAEIEKLASGLREGLLAKEERPSTNYFDETGQQRTGFFSNRERGRLGSLNAERTTEQQGAREAGITTATKQAEQDVTNLPANQRGRARGAGMVAGSEAQSRENVEQRNFPNILNRKVTEAASVAFAKLPYEIEATKARIFAEASQAGNRALAEEGAKKSAAVKGLLPTYQKYRQLALDVSSSWAGAGSPTSGAAVNAVSKLPAIGEFVAASTESIHALLANVPDPAIARKITELNRLGDVLAQGMANAVIGNRGQTTENDRRTAKGILASSFTDAKTLEDLLSITDKMMAILPDVAARESAGLPPGQAPDVASVLQQVATQARGGAATSPHSPGSSGNTILDSALEKLNAR